MGKRRFEVFLSHNSSDKPWVIRLKEALERRGRSVWLDRDEIRPGDQFAQALEDGIQSSSAVALIVSPEAIESGWVRREYYRALSLAASGQLQLIPVILRDAQLPGFLSDLNWIDFRDEGCYEESLDRLVWGITGEKPTVGTRMQAGPPHLPADCLSRPKVVTRIEQVFLDQGDSTTRSCVLFGPSGFGKSTTARQYYDEREGSKRWLYATSSEEPQPKAQRNLLIVDDLDLVSGDIFGKNEWIPGCQADVLALTSQESVANQILRKRGCTRNCDTYVACLPGFSDEECAQYATIAFVETALQFMSFDTLRALNAYVHGCPYIWALVADLVERRTGDLFDLFSTMDTHDDYGQVADKVFVVWLDKVASDPLTRSILGIVCCISILGINENALAHLVGKERESISAVVQRLERRGFVQRRYDGSITPHALVRAACQDLLSPKAPGKIYQKYLDYLDAELSTDRVRASEFFTLLDAWVIGVRRAFVDAIDAIEHGDPSRANLFLPRYSQSMDSLERLLGVGRFECCHKEWLAEFLVGRIMNLECWHVIAFAQFIAELPKKDAFFAELMWEGSTHKDGWARGECIFAAALHWTEQGDEIAHVGKRRLSDFADSYIDRCHSADEQKNWTEDEWALSSLVGGLCLLGATIEAEILADVARREHPDCALVYALFLVENNLDHKLQRYLERCWDKIPTSIAKILVTEFLIATGRQLQREERGQIRFHAKEMWNKVARMAQAEQFQAFLKSLAAQSKDVGGNVFETTVPSPVTESWKPRA